MLGRRGEFCFWALGSCCGGKGHEVGVQPGAGACPRGLLVRTAGRQERKQVKEADPLQPATRGLELLLPSIAAGHVSKVLLSSAPHPFAVSVPPACPLTAVCPTPRLPRCGSLVAPTVLLGPAARWTFSRFCPSRPGAGLAASVGTFRAPGCPSLVLLRWPLWFHVQEGAGDSPSVHQIFGLVLERKR